jgi:plastocyanin
MTCRRVISIVLSAACVTGGALLAATTMAGPDKIAFPEGFEKGVLYATVDRHDIKQYRELYSTPQAQTDAEGKPLKGADGKFVKGKLLGYTVMEKRQGWGVEYPAEWRNGEWEYAAFTVDKKPNEKANANAKNCFVCHKPHERQDFVMSLASLSGTSPKGAAMKPSGPSSVAIAEFLFGPQKMAVKQGQTITWTNVDDSPHQVTVQGQTEYRSPVLLKGQTTSLTFAHVGTYDYICGLHPGMKGSVEVTK